MNLSLSIFFVPHDPQPCETCVLCKEIITGNKYVIMIQGGKVTDGKLTALDKGFCSNCYNQMQYDDAAERLS